MHKRAAILNLAINIGFSGIRFILQFVLFAKLSDGVIADWGIAAQVILMLSFWSGLELHQVINRNFVQGEGRLQLVWERITFAAMLCLGVAFVGYGNRPGFSLILAAVGLIDYLVIEVIRLLNVIGKYILGSLITNLRSLWMVPPLFLKCITLNDLMVIYGVFGALLLMVAVAIGLRSVNFDMSFEWRLFIQRIAQVSSFILLGIYSAVEPVVSRLIIGERYGKSMLAMFIVFGSVVSVLQIVLGSLVLQPRLGRVLAGSSCFCAMDAILSFGLLTVFLFGAFFFLDILLGMINKLHFSGNLPVLFIMAIDVTAQFILSLLVYNIHAKRQANRLLLLITCVKVMAIAIFFFASLYLELWKALSVLLLGSVINIMIGAYQDNYLRRLVNDKY